VWAGLNWLRTGTGCCFGGFKEKFKRTFDLFKSEQKYHMGLFFKHIKYNVVVSLKQQYRTNKKLLMKSVLCSLKCATY
jgi:hypothetical protein